ncbi:MAG: hypothetical protein AB8B56_09935 [Crocinitomicaceae bacterium]
MKQFILPTGKLHSTEQAYVLAQGSALLFQNPVHESEYSGSYPENKVVAPNWTILNQTSFVPLVLPEPLVYAEKVNGAIDVYSNIMIPSNLIKTLSVVVYLSEPEKMIYVVACYNGVDNSDQVSHKIKISIPDCSEIAGISELTMYLLKPDPKTSRGTVTTVQNLSITRSSI